MYSNREEELRFLLSSFIGERFKKVMKVAVIPARRGSVGFPNKNLQRLSGLSLLDRTIKFVTHLGLFDRVIVTTDYTEDEYIPGNYEVRERPKELATSSATMVDVLLDVVNACNLSNKDFVVLFQPTSPFRTKDSVESVLDLLEGYDSVITVKELDLNLSLVVRPVSSTELQPKEVSAEETNRQHQGLTYYPNGNLFGVRVGSFLKNKSFYGGNQGYLLQEGKLNIDINSKTDLDLAIQVNNTL